MAGRGSAAPAPRGSAPREVAPPKGKPPKWEKVAQGDLPPFWDPRSKGDSIEGPIISIRPNQFDTTNYTIKDVKKGVHTLRSHTQLMGLFDQIQPSIKKGDLVRVTFTGEEQGPNGKYFTYDLEFARTQAPF